MKADTEGSPALQLQTRLHPLLRDRTLALGTIALCMGCVVGAGAGRLLQTTVSASWRRGSLRSKCQDHGVKPQHESNGCGGKINASSFAAGREETVTVTTGEVLPL